MGTDGRISEFVEIIANDHNVFCGDNCFSIMRPLIWKIVRLHMQPVSEDSDLSTTFKKFVSTKLQNFKLTE